MRSGFKQPGGLLSITTPLGADDLILDALDGSEGISELFRFSLAMRSGKTSLSATSVVGKDVTITIEIPDGPKRYISGIVNRFVHTGQDVDFASYQAEVVPKLWLLTLARERRIFQTQSVKDIIKAVLGEFSVKLEDKLTGTYPALDYVVQYDETHFDFISRLMEQVGIFYYFKFASGSHTMVLADATSAHVDCTDAKTMRYFPQTGLVNAIDTVYRFEHEHRVVLKELTVSDYDYLTPSTSLEGAHAATAGSGKSFEYPAGHTKAADAAALAKVWVQSAQVQAQTLRGHSYAYPFTAGCKFTLKDHFVTALNDSYVLRRVQHLAQDDAYTNLFEAFPADVPFRPARVTPQPRALGSETALVVGSSGEEIWTDEHGRIKVQFPWDREGKKNEKSSPWIRVSQTVADKGFGALFLPRVGQEVVITYINGDPSRPLVTGCVYNGENKTPVTLPANQTQSTIKTRSSKKGTAGNEIRMEDKKDAEQLYMHAQKDMAVEIENDLSTKVIKGNETRTIEEGNRTTELKKGNESLTVKGTRTVAITGDEKHTNAADYTHEIKGNFKQTVDGDYALTVKGSLTITVTGGITIKSSDSVLMQSGAAMTLKGGSTLTAQAGTDLTAKAGMNMKNEAGMQMDHKATMINSKASGMQTVEASGILTLKGALVKIN